jgi:hypothetical protein
VFYYCEALSSLGAACRALHCSSMSPSRAGASARRGVTAPNAHAWKCQAHARVAKSVAKGRSHRRLPGLWQKDSNAIRYEDQEVRRSNTELTAEGPQADPIH